MFKTLAKAMLYIVILSILMSVATVVLVMLLGSNANAATPMETAEAGASTVVDSIAADAAAFPLFVGLIVLFVGVVFVWSAAEVLKDTLIAKLKRAPSKSAGEVTVYKKLSRQWGWYPFAIWMICLVGGSGVGMIGGAIDGFGPGDLGWWGPLFGLVGGLLSKAFARYGRKYSDKLGEILFGRLKRMLGGGGSDAGEG
jgi:hypothetical protein